MFSNVQHRVHSQNFTVGRVPDSETRLELLCHTIILHRGSMDRCACFFFFFLLIIDDDNDFLFLFSRYFSKRSVVAFIQDYSLQFGDLIRFCFYIGFS